MRKLVIAHDTVHVTPSGASAIAAETEKFFLCVSHVNMIIKHVENHEKNFSVSARIFRIVPHRPSSSLNKIAVPLAIFPRPSNSVYIIYSEFEGIWGISTLMVDFP